MILHDYKCKACEKVMELEKKSIKDPAFTICPECGGELIRLFTYTPPVKFKGTGWYETDYKNSNGGSSDAVPVKNPVPVKDNSSDDIKAAPSRKIAANKGQS